MRVAATQETKLKMHKIKASAWNHYNIYIILQEFTPIIMFGVLFFPKCDLVFMGFALLMTEAICWPCQMLMGFFLLVLN